MNSQRATFCKNFASKCSSRPIWLGVIQRKKDPGWDIDIRLAREAGKACASLAALKSTCSMAQTITSRQFVNHSVKSSFGAGLALPPDQKSLNTYTGVLTPSCLPEQTCFGCVCLGKKSDFSDEGCRGHKFPPELRNDIVREACSQHLLLEDIWLMCKRQFLPSSVCLFALSMC